MVDVSIGGLVVMEMNAVLALIGMAVEVPIMKKVILTSTSGGRARTQAITVEIHVASSSGSLFSSKSAPGMIWKMSLSPGCTNMA